MLEITSLIENCSDGTEFHSEHGLALFIQQDNNRYLLDTGATSNFIENAEKLGIDLKKT